MTKRRAAPKKPAPKRKKVVAAPSNPVPPPTQPPPSTSAPDLLDVVKDLMNSRPLRQEREFPPNALFKFHKLATEHLGLGNLLASRATGNETFVRHFYYYARCHGISSMQLRGVPPCGKNFISPEFIRQFYDLPFYPQCQYHLLKKEAKNFPFKAIADTLVKPGEPQWYRPRGKQIYLKQRSLNEEAIIWLNFITFNVTPVGNSSTVPKLNALLIFLFMTGQHVKLENILYDTLYNCAHAKRKGTYLVLPHLISDLFTKAQIPASSDDIYFQPSPPYRYDQTTLDHKGPADLDGDQPPLTLRSLHDELLLAKRERAKERLHRQRVETLLEGLASKMGVEVPPRVESDEEKDPSTHHRGKEIVVFRGPAEEEIGEDSAPSASESADDDEVVSVGEDEDLVSSRAADADTSESEYDSADDSDD